MKISIVIPLLDEERRIGERLAELRAFEEVIVVDGGSGDRTVEIARAFPGVQVVSAARGRASQMNHGARLARYELLLFLHADVSPPPDAAAQIERAMRDPRHVAGAFRIWHVAEDGRSAPWLHLAGLRSRYSRLPYGDQALFVHASIETSAELQVPPDERLEPLPFRGRNAGLVGPDRKRERRAAGTP